MVVHVKTTEIPLNCLQSTTVESNETVKHITVIYQKVQYYSNYWQLW